MRRGIPSVLWSDNGTNFVASEKELLLNITNWNQEALSEELAKGRIHWKFNTPSAPHHWEVWESVVRSFKHVFYEILGNRCLTDEIFSPTFCSVEQSLNYRPFVPLSSDATGLDALTPITSWWARRLPRYHHISKPRLTAERAMSLQVVLRIADMRPI